MFPQTKSKHPDRCKFLIAELNWIGLSTKTISQLNYKLPQLVDLFNRVLLRSNGVQIFINFFEYMFNVQSILWSYKSNYYAGNELIKLPISSSLYYIYAYCWYIEWIHPVFTTRSTPYNDRVQLNYGKDCNLNYDVWRHNLMNYEKK